MRKDMHFQPSLHCVDSVGADGLPLTGPTFRCAWIVRSTASAAADGVSSRARLALRRTTNSSRATASNVSAVFARPHLRLRLTAGSIPFTRSRRASSRFSRAALSDTFRVQPERQQLFFPVGTAFGKAVFESRQPSTGGHYDEVEPLPVEELKRLLGGPCRTNNGIGEHLGVFLLGQGYLPPFLPPTARRLSADNAIHRWTAFSGFSGACVLRQPPLDASGTQIGGADGTRTRDPRRDRPVF
jgi:hypothetical protein